MSFVVLRIKKSGCNFTLPESFGQLIQNVWMKVVGTRDICRAPTYDIHVNIFD